MTGASFNRPYKPFGLNIKVPEKTLEQAGETLKNASAGAITPLFQYLEKNENIFSGDINKEINKTVAQSFTTGVILQEEDLRTNGAPPTLDIHF